MVQGLSTSSIRSKRVGATILKHLSGELAREVADPRLAALGIEGVELSSDLSLARVKVRLMVGGESPQVRQEVLAALGRLAPGLRSSLSPVLRMRRTPELRFSYDEALDRRAEIDAVLQQIEREDAEKKAEIDRSSGTEPQKSSSGTKPQTSSSGTEPKK